MLNDRLLPNGIETATDGVAHTLGDNLNAASRIAIEVERHRQNCFQPVPLCATGWGDIGGAAGNSDTKIKNGFYSVGQKTGTVIADVDALPVNDKRNRRSHRHLLSGVQRVINQLVYASRFALYRL